MNDGVDDRVDVRDSTAAVLAAGCRRIGFVGTDDPVGAQRLAGFLDAHAALGLGVEEDLVVLGTRSAAAVSAACHALWARREPADAILVDVSPDCGTTPGGVLAAVAPGIVPHAIARVGSLPG